MSYEVDPIYGCWLWTGRVDREGYPMRYERGKFGSVHRQEWIDTIGPIEKGLELEHACRRRKCIRPSHKYLVTRSENLKLKAWRRRAAIKECPEGHALRRWSLRTPEGGYVCKECNKGKA